MGTCRERLLRFARLFFISQLSNVKTEVAQWYNYRGSLPAGHYGLENSAGVGEEEEGEDALLGHGRIRRCQSAQLFSSSSPAREKKSKSNKKHTKTLKICCLS